MDDAALIRKVFSNPEQKIVLKIKTQGTRGRKAPNKSSSSSSSGGGNDSETWRQYASRLSEDGPTASSTTTTPTKGGKYNNNNNSNNHKLSAKPVLSKWDMSNLSSRNPLSSDLDFMLCSYCQRPCLTAVLQHHVDTACPKAPHLMENGDSAEETGVVNGIAESKKRKSGDQDDVDALSDATVTTPNKTKKQYKKRKVANGVDTPDQLATPNGGSPVPRAKKAKKEKPKATTKVAKPVDVERQCGVPLDNGQLCARSLTCKTHSMGAKRAVQGRSAAYDVLLSQYQRKNLVKLASSAAAQQLADDNEALAGALPINPEEEVAQVMEGVRRAAATVAPLEKKVVLSTRVKHQFIRMREMFAAALQPRGAPTTGGITGLFGRANAFVPDHPENLHFIPPPSLRYFQALRHQQLQKQQQYALQQQKLQQQQQQFQQQQQQQQQQQLQNGVHRPQQQGPQ